MIYVRGTPYAVPVLAAERLGQALRARANVSAFICADQIHTAMLLLLREGVPLLVTRLSVPQRRFCTNLESPARLATNILFAGLTTEQIPAAIGRILMGTRNDS